MLAIYSLLLESLYVAWRCTSRYSHCEISCKTSCQIMSNKNPSM